MDQISAQKSTPTSKPRITAILPCNDLDAAELFFARLGFTRRPGDRERYPAEHEYDYRILVDGSGADIHLNQAVKGWVVAGKNPFGLYIYSDHVDVIAEEFGEEIIEKSKKAEFKEWGMYEFSVNGPDGVLVRIGAPAGEGKEKGEDS